MWLLFTALGYVLGASLAFLLAFYIYGLRPLDRWRFRHFPGEHGKWFVMNMPDSTAAGQHRYQAAKAKQYGDIFKLHCYQGPEIVVTSPVLARQVLLTNVNRYPLPGLIDVSLNETHPGFNQNHIITARDDSWRSLRQAVDPFFLPGSLESYAPKINSASRVMVKRLAAFAGTGEHVDIYRGLVDLTIDVIAGISFGIDLHTQEPERQAENPLFQTVQKDAEACMHGFTATKWFLLTSHFPEIRPYLTKLATWFPDAKLKHYFAAQRRIVEIGTALLKQHREKVAAESDGSMLPGRSSLPNRTSQLPGRTSNLPNGTSHLANGTANGDMPSRLSQRPSDIVGKLGGSKRRGVAPGSFLDLLVRGTDPAGKPFNDGLIVRQCHAMLMAGYETTAVTLASTVYNLSKTPEAAERFAKEALAQPEDPTLDSVEKMVWAEACLKESLRLYPSAPVGGRQAQQDMVLGGYKIKKGTALKVALWALQRHPDLWENPDEFVPARWIEGAPEAAKTPADGFWGFGGGARGCPGRRLAWEEAKIALVHLYRKYRFFLAPGQDPLPLRNTMTLSPSKGVFVRVEHR